MCVLVSPDYREVTSTVLWRLRFLVSLRILKLDYVSDSILIGREGQKDPLKWIRELPDTMRRLSVSGELLWHIHIVSVHTETRCCYGMHNGLTYFVH